MAEEVNGWMWSGIAAVAAVFAVAEWLAARREPWRQGGLARTSTGLGATHDVPGTVVEIGEERRVAVATEPVSGVDATTLDGRLRIESARAMPCPAR